MTKFPKFFQMAHRMIAAKGAPAVWRIPGVTVDAGMPWKEVEAPATEHDVTVVILPCDRYQFESLGWDFKTQELDSAEICYMPAYSFNPSLKHQLVVGGKSINIENIVTYKPDGHPLLHVMLVRP